MTDIWGAYVTRPRHVAATQLTRDNFAEVRRELDARTFTTDESIMFNDALGNEHIMDVGQWAVMHSDGKIELMSDVMFRLDYQKAEQ